MKDHETTARGLSRNIVDADTGHASIEDAGIDGPQGRTRAPKPGRTRPPFPALWVRPARTALLLAWALSVGPAHAQDGGSAAHCAPEVHEAFVASAEAGVARQVAIVRDELQGIRDPDSLFSLSCVEDLFDYKAYDIHFDAGAALRQILNLAQSKVCAAARDAHRRYVGRALDTRLYSPHPPDLPGLSTSTRRGNLLDEAAVPRQSSSPGGGPSARDLETFRNILGE